jgi:hypothetical protein
MHVKARKVAFVAILPFMGTYIHTCELCRDVWRSEAV